MSTAAVERVLTTEIQTPLGAMLIGATTDGICLCEFADRRALPAELTDLATHFGAPVEPGPSDHADLLAAELAAYFKGDLREFRTPLVTPGTPFERDVWARLLQIPYGSTTSYGAMAAGMGKPGASRAVGRANGRNRIAIVIPCHRVIESTGALRGYGGGLWRKQRLLDLERSHAGGTLWSPAAANAIN